MEVNVMATVAKAKGNKRGPKPLSEAEKSFRMQAKAFHEMMLKAHKDLPGMDLVNIIKIILTVKGI